MPNIPMPELPPSYRTILRLGRRNPEDVGPPLPVYMEQPDGSTTVLQRFALFPPLKREANVLTLRGTCRSESRRARVSNDSVCVYVYTFVCISDFFCLDIA